MMCVPDGQALQWFVGTPRSQCERSASGHWLLGVGHWDKVRPEEVVRVLNVLPAGGPPRV